MWLSYAGLCAAVLSLAGVFLYLDPQVPRAETYRNVQLETPLRIYSEDGALLAEYGERRLIPITLDNVPEHFINALLDTEDKRFYEHSGIDFISLANDLVGLVGSLITEGSLGPGASTITMQLARNVSFSLERRFLRKFKEMLLALKIERELTKDEILELYINVVPFGKRAYGAEAAALTYYGKPLKELTLPQLAMLAGIPQAPSAANPINGPERALARRNVVLSRMRAQDSITDAEYQDALSQPISASIFARELDVASPYAAEWVRQQTVGLLPDLYTAGYEIYTTIDSSMQTEAIAALRRGLIDYDRRHGYRGPEAQAPAELIEELEAASDLLASILNPSADGADAATDPETDADTETDSVIEAIFGDETGSLDYPTDIRDDALAFLSQFLFYGDLEPVLVVATSDEGIVVLRPDATYLRLAFEDSAWARPYIDVDLRGPPPAGFQELTNVGDVVRLQNRAGKLVFAQLPEIQGALISMSPRDGRVKAIVGGFDFYRNQYNHALQAARQPGSGFKPFVYSAALGAGVKPSDIFMDAPLVFDDANLESQYRPDNDNNKYNGPTRLREALYRSINLVSMRVLLKISAGNVLDHAQQLSFDTARFPRNTQLAIGGGTMAVTPLDMVRAYTIFANGGYLVEPHIVDYILDSQGQTLSRPQHVIVCRECEKVLEDELTEDLEDIDDEAASLTELIGSLREQQADADARSHESTAPPGGQSLADMETETEPETGTDAETDADSVAGTPLLDENGVNPLDLPRDPIPAERVLDERNAFIITTMLKDVIKRGTGRRALTLGREDIAGKTGTTNDAADTWFNGFTPELATTVWVGFSNHEPLGARAFGSNTPLPIWIDYMEDALAEIPEVIPPQPSGVVSMKIDPRTGEVAAPGQANGIFEYFLEEHTPPTRRASNPGTSSETEEVKAIDLF